VLVPWIINLLTTAPDPVADILVQYIQSLLAVETYRLAFIATNGAVSGLLELLQRTAAPQMQYQLVYCFWLLSFVPKGAADFSK
jgi:V-type H+-transporting ATPase subunit H